MTDEAGSYAFGAFAENEKELDRLQRQARAAAPLEKKIWQQLGLQKDMRVLDLACGPGIISCELARFVETGSVLGVDISPELIEVARKNRAASGMENVSFKVGNIYEPDPDCGTFDWAYARFLYQHLEKPRAALRHTLAYLKPRGTACVIDVDDRWLQVCPATAAFESFTARAAAGQSRNGGDRHVGHKLGEYMHAEGYVNIRTAVVVVPAAELGMKNFLDLTTGFKMEQIPADQKEIAARELAEIYSLVDAPYAWGSVGIFAVTGSRPE